MAVNKKNIMTRYFFVVLLLSLVGIAIVVKAGVIMFAEGCTCKAEPRKCPLCRWQTNGKLAA